MPIHNWSGVSDGMFHYFHQRWIGTIADLLNETARVPRSIGRNDVGRPSQAGWTGWEARPTSFFPLMMAGCLMLTGCSGPAPPPAADPKPADTREPEPALPPFLNALSPQELADGTLLLFDGASTFGWRIDGDARVEEGVLKIGGARPTTARTAMRFARSQVAASIGRTGQPAEDIYLNDGAVRAMVLKSTQFGEGKFYAYGWPHEGQTWSWGKGGLTFQSYSTSPPVNMTVPAGTQLLLRNVKLSFPRGDFKPAPLKAWAPLPGSKAVFADAPEGWQVLRGGAVRSEEEIPHFALQLEARLTGANAHADIVVRAPAEKLETGLAFTLQAKDDGTLDAGSLAGKQDARKTLARSGEPFYLTVVVCENDFAAWVNGIQVMAWSAGPVAKDQNFARAPVILRALHPDTELSVRRVRHVKLIGDWFPPKKAKRTSDK